jgi:NADPH-dependent dioxygenase
MFGRKKHPAALVVGAGPVGLCTALCLVRRGIEVQVIDSERQPATHSYALALHPTSIELLDRLGLREEVLDGAKHVERVAFFDHHSREAEVDLSRLDTPYPFLAVLGQARFESVLERALREAGVKVQWNHRLARFSQSGAGVSVDIDKLTEGSVGYASPHSEWVVSSSKTIEVPFVIGADGYRSLVRQQLEIPFPEVRPVQTFAVFEFDTDADLGGEMRVVLDEKSSNVLWPVSDGACRFSFELQGADIPDDFRDKDRNIYEDASSAFPELETEVLHRLLAERAPWFQGNVGDIRWRVVVPFESRLATSFGSGRMWMVGDAAHTMGPVGVRSMNIGLLEGEALAATIARSVDGSGSMSEFERYGTARTAEWKNLLGLSGRLASTEGTGAWVQRRAERMQRCLPASGPHLRQLLDQLHLTQA